MCLTVADKEFLVRQLVPKSYHFDGYNENIYTYLVGKGEV